MASPELDGLEMFDPKIQIELLRTRADDLRNLLVEQRAVISNLETRWKHANTEYREAQYAYQKRLAKAESLK